MEVAPPTARAQRLHNSCRESDLDIDHFGLNLKVDCHLAGPERRDNVSRIR